MNNIKVDQNILTIGGYLHVRARNGILLVVGDSYPIIKIEGWMVCDFSDTLSLIWSLGVLTVSQKRLSRCFELTSGDIWREL